MGIFSQFTPSTLRNFLSTHFTPDRLVLSAVGVNPDAFLQSAEKLFGSVAKRSDQASIARPAVRYVGGDVRSHYKDDNALTHLAVAFETGILLSMFSLSAAARVCAMEIKIFAL